MKTYPNPVGESVVKWVSTNWLKDHINDNNLIIFDVDRLLRHGARGYQ